MKNKRTLARVVVISCDRVTQQIRDEERKGEETGCQARVCRRSEKGMAMSYFQERVRESEREREEAAAAAETGGWAVLPTLDCCFVVQGWLLASCLRS